MTPSPHGKGTQIDGQGLEPARCVYDVYAPGRPPRDPHQRMVLHPNIFEEIDTQIYVGIGVVIGAALVGAIWIVCTWI